MCTVAAIGVLETTEVFVPHEADEQTQPRQAGEENANCRLTDQRVRELRKARADSRERADADETGETQPLDWPQLGEMFHLSAKHAYRICKGMVRREAGGPIEPLDNPSKVEVLRDFVRCRACGGKHHKHDECQPCQVQWAALISQYLEPYGWVNREAA